MYIIYLYLNVRQKVVEKLLSFLKNSDYGLDGLDLDLQYPMKEHKAFYANIIRCTSIYLPSSFH